MSFIVVYDANVLYPNTLRDLLLRIAQAGLVQAKWTDDILDEVVGDQVDLSMNLVYGAVQQISDARRNPPERVPEVLDQLERQGLLASVAALRS